MTWLISGFNPSWVLKDSGEYAGYGAQGREGARELVGPLTLVPFPLEDVLKSGKELPKTKPAAKPVRTAAAEWGSFTHCPSIQFPASAPTDAASSLLCRRARSRRTPPYFSCSCDIRPVSCFTRACAFT